jgi:hypothetical protein
MYLVSLSRLLPLLLALLLPLQAPARPRRW